MAAVPNCFPLNILCPSCGLRNPGVTFACLLKHGKLFLVFLTHKSLMGLGQSGAPLFHTIQWYRLRALTFSKLLPDGHLLFPRRKEGEAAGLIFQGALRNPTQH